MNRIALDLEHCYGIKKLSVDLDFSTERVYALYAPNGVMKSSLAQTFYDISKGTASKDRIFSDRTSKRTVLDENGNDLSKDSVFVVRPYDAEFGHSEKTSLLLVEASLRKEYAQIHEGIVRQKNALLAALKKQSKSKRDFEKEISSAFTATTEEFDKALQRIEKELAEQKDAIFAMSLMTLSSMRKFWSFSEHLRRKRSAKCMCGAITNYWKHQPISKREPLTITTLAR